MAVLKNSFKAPSGAMPKHVAVIMDGNGRWAKARQLKRIEGHRQGALVLEKLLEDFVSLKIPVVSLYAFSTENWKRPQTEVHALFELLEEFITSKSETLLQLGVRLMVSGNMAQLPKKLQKKILELEKKTLHKKKLMANFCLNYGSRDEIKKAALQVLQTRWKKLSLEAHATNVKEARLNTIEKKLFRKITEKEFTSQLYTASLPDVDLLIRTAGEKRLSNFLLYQSAYAELYFTDTLWPDFNTRELYKALEFYQSRIRKFGGLDE